MVVSRIRCIGADACVFITEDERDLVPSANTEQRFTFFLDGVVAEIKFLLQVLVACNKVECVCLDGQPFICRTRAHFPDLRIVFFVVSKIAGRLKAELSQLKENGSCVM
jgi:hypothetical protein